MKDKFEPGLPSPEELRRYIQESNDPLNKREIARAFGIKGQDRMVLRKMLRELAEEGAIEKNPGKSYQPPNSLPERGLIEIIGLDGDGELLAKPLHWHGKGPAPLIYVMDRRRSEGYLQPGDQILARLKKTGRLEYEARILKALDEAALQVIGVFKPHKGAGYVYPTDKKNKEDYFIPPEFCEGLTEGDLVMIEQIPPTAKYPKSKNPSRVTKLIGKKDDPRLISLIAIHSHGIPVAFSKEVISEADKAAEVDLSGGRTDLRHLPLVTIDGADARDFDDAVYAEQDTDPANPDGWNLMVAIADVSWYVRPGSALDRSAFERGNSTYFADRVVPMLPEQLSNELCSLKPNVNRACLAVTLTINNKAKLIGYKFTRGLMRSAARLTYEQVDAAHKGYPDDSTGPLMESVIQPLYKAYSLLKKAREERGALELDLPERKALIDAQGIVTAIVPRVRLDSHQLIEEFMILANVAAASVLEDKSSPCVFRVHAAPASDRLETTREFLKGLGYSLPKAEHLHPKNLNHILKLSAERPDKDLVHTVLLRTQSQAVYSPENIGHFGLALEKYAHFTSPIRRYADLIVHRSLVHACRLGEGGLPEADLQSLEEISQHISITERRSMLAERDCMDRFTAQYLRSHVGQDFKGRISGVTHFGIFVTLDDSGADGIVPIRMLPRDYYIHDEKRHALVGKNNGLTWRLADAVVVRLVEADSLRGSTVFEIAGNAAAESLPDREHRPFTKRKKPQPQGKRPDKKGKDRKKGAKKPRRS